MREKTIGFIGGGSATDLTEDGWAIVSISKPV